MSIPEVRIAHSPDADDFFMFWPLREGLIDSADLEFTFEAFDTQTLNNLAKSGTYDVIAISLASYPGLVGKYGILTHGASIGDNYGPVLVAKKNLSLSKLKNQTIGVPGHGTTAACILRKILPDASMLEISISPYQKIFDALLQDEIAAALLIHEGQITYKSQGFEKILDLGAWWKENTNLPLPLGVNVIKLQADSKRTTLISKLIKQSIRYALLHKQELIGELLKHSAARGVEIIDPSELDKYLSMYANEDSYSMSGACKTAIRELLGGEVELVFVD